MFLKKISLTTYIFLSLIIGVIVGSVLFNTLGIESRTAYSKNITIFSDIFLRLIKMVIAPLVLTLLVSGVAKIGDTKMIGRMGTKTILWFLVASIISLLIGMIVMNITQLGSSLQLDASAAAANAAPSAIKTEPMSFYSFITHIFPKSIVDAMAHNEILQVVIFSVFFGIAAASMKEKVKIVIDFFDSATHVLLKVISNVMYLSPLAAFASVSAMICLNGPGLLKTYALFIITFYGSLFLLWCILIGVGFIYLRHRIFTLIKRIFKCFIIAFSASTSEAAYPSLIKELKAFGCDEKVINFVLPLGYSFNLDGSIMYTTFATFFIAQAYQIHLPIETQVAILGFLLVTSKGIAGVPRASLVIIAGALTAFHIPEAGLALLLGIDQVLDMARSGTNLIGNSIATAVISKMENKLSAETDVTNIPD